MDDANATVTTLAELLQSPRPVTATAHSVFSSTPPPHRSTTCCVLTALPRSTVLVGTLALPALSPPCSCLRFSDASATLCCDLLRFRPAALNREIRVTAWNFIPFKRHGCDVAHGLLEIINWRFSDTNQGSNAVDSLPLAPNCVRQSGARMRSLHGVVESVGPLFVVQCTMAASTSGLNSGSKVNLPGFSVQLVCCECRFCCSKEVLIGKLNETRKGHSFTKMEIVYFCGSASSWHPAITKLIDERVVVSGLKKKLVYLTKEESREMYVTKDESVLHVESCSEKCMPSLKSEIKGKGECGSYSGVVKGAYMQGMVLELDHDVWLLLTDQLHTSMHGLRVGSILSVRNVHIVNPHFSWTKIIILGACIKTSIIVQSFSPCQTVCNVVFPSTGMLGKFIQSLPFSARLWVLLLVSSFRKKFDGILSDKEILGSKHKEGLVQMYASSLFPWSIFQTQQGAPLWLCTHDLNGCGRVLNCSFLKLVIPISIFICHCIHTLLRIMKSESHCKLLPIGNQFSILSREARYNGRSLRRIIQSEDVGVVLLGYLKVDPSTRRLQLVDATGGVDIVIQDLPLTWNPNEIYEVTDYEVFMDKIDEPVDQIERLGSESLSCRTIFDCSKAERELSTPFFVCCHWKNVKCRNIPLYSCINSKNESETLEPGSYHVLRVSHKFPLQEKVNICGSVNKHTFPTGFGSGVTAVFHRILYARAQNKFMLLPVSFIVIKSIKVCDKQCGDRPSVLSATKDADDASREYISCLISELPQGLTHKKIVLRCRVVAVLVLVIERKTTNFIAETKVNAQGTLLDIPLACFLLEDGSSSCCCWASAERAATLLRLREELTTSHHLGRILKKHKKITVKSHGLSVDSPCQDHIFTVASGNALCSSDENILKFIICNACIGGIWNVVAGGMDAEETRQLGEEYLTEMLNVHNMRNMWAEEVSYPRTRAEARHMIQELLKN
ncbi:CST complex subunit CTC1 isoform X2 [Vigna radiata var. radiata]|uniref:CST complex subunit CTC1 n=1 Tax=Vigna radiata var. radiata TaxID=3916 RepID=A0A3Q0EU07_VIGRR|nr:CST complex subunit CTC1 isoform X2 [Vigna radiata var. radiata]